MKKTLSLFLITVALVSAFPGCKKEEGLQLTEADAKEVIINYNSEAVISDCVFDKEANVYEIKFKTSYGLYNSIINAADGNIISVTIEQDEAEEPMFQEPSEEEDKESLISINTALSIALSDSGVNGTASLVKNDLNRENKTFTIIFRSGNKEYNYIINAVTGEIISSETEMDS